MYRVFQDRINRAFNQTHGPLRVVMGCCPGHTWPHPCPCLTSREVPAPSMKLSVSLTSQQIHHWGLYGLPPGMLCPRNLGNCFLDNEWWERQKNLRTLLNKRRDEVELDIWTSLVHLSLSNVTGPFFSFKGGSVVLMQWHCHVILQSVEKIQNMYWKWKNYMWRKEKETTNCKVQLSYLWPSNCYVDVLYAT